MRKRVSATAIVGSIGVALAAAACGLGFSDLELGPGPEPSATSTPTGTGPTANPTSQPTTPPTGDPVDGGSDAPGDASADVNLPEASPPPTTARPQVLVRFDANYSCGIPFTRPICTRNDGTLPRNGKVIDPGDTEITNVFPLTGIFNPKGGSTEIEQAADLVPVTPPTKLTVAAWVRRAGDTREYARIVSFANEKNGDKPVFELGYVNQADTKLAFAIDDELAAGKTSAVSSLLGQDEWTFVAVTYDRAPEAGTDELCFFRGTGSTLTPLACESYGGRNIRRPSGNPRLAIGHAARPKERAEARSFPGKIDNVYVFVGEALDMAELQKIFNDGHS